MVFMFCISINELIIIIITIYSILSFSLEKKNVYKLQDVVIFVLNKHQWLLQTD